MLNKINIVLVILLLVVVVLLGLSYYNSKKIILPTTPTPQIITNTIIQTITQEPIIKIKTNKIYIYVSELNRFLTNKGSIIVSKDKITASLYKRSWSMAYSISRRLNHVYLYAGQYFGVGYSRTIFNNFMLGANFILCDKTGYFSFIAGYQF